MIQPDIVFVDTSVFIAENYFAQGNRINSLAKLAKEKKIRLVMSEITRQEIYKHIKSSVRHSWKAFNEDSKIFRNNVEIDKWRKSTNEKKEIESITSLFEWFLEDTKTKILDYGYCTNATKIFENYFAQQKPFGEGQKKDEFPDAFVLTSLEKYSKEIHQRIIILSTDGDMEGYESKELVFEDYRKYVSKKVAEGVALDEMVKHLREEKYYLEEKIKEAATDYLDDFRLYQSLLNLTEVSYHTVNKVNVEINEDDYEIISVNSSYIEFEIRPEISFQVDVEYVSYDTAVYDREDGKWYGTEDETYEVDAVADVCTTVRLYYNQGHCVDYLDIQDIDLGHLSDVIE